MISARLRDTTRNSAATMRVLALAMYFAGLLLHVGAAQAAQVRDHSRRSLAPAMTERFKAPIGHRQPTTGDLPQTVLRDEGGVTRNQRDLDKQLDICLGC